MSFLSRLGQVPNPTPRPPQGFLDGLMRMQMQPMQLAQPGQAPTEARVGTARAPSGFLDRLHQGVADNRGMLMGLGTGLLSQGWEGASNAMPGMQHDEARRSQAAEQERADRQSAAQRQLGQQFGIDPLVFDAGMGGEALSNALRPQENFRPLSTEEQSQLGLPTDGRFQVGPNGRITQIGGRGTTVNIDNVGEVGTIPPGWELFTDPDTGARSMKPVQGGPEDTQGEVQSARATASDVIVNASTRALGAARNRDVDGLAGRAASVFPETANAEVYRQVSSLQAIASAEALNAMRRQSPTGGALGNVTERELELLQQQAGALDPASPNFERDLADYTRALLRTVHGYEEGTRVFNAQLGSSFAPTQSDAPHGVDPQVWEFMTPDERALWN